MPVVAEYQKILEIAKRKQKENKTFLKKLKNINPSDLDFVTNEFHDKAFSKIDCMKCANCCTTTGPLLKNRDINTLSSHHNIRPSDFTEKYLRTDEDGDYVFKKMPCPFIGDDNHCSVYSYRPRACRDFPHTQQRNIKEKLPVTYLNTLICPAVAIVVDHLKMHYQKKMRSS
jgi:Fe-S-cluster containining protein